MIQKDFFSIFATFNKYQNVMRNLGIIILSIILLASLGSCTKENWAFKTDQLYQKNKKSVTIKQGVWGTVTERTGNWMPGPGRPSKSAKEYPIQCEIKAYELTSFFDLERNGNSLEITNIPTKLVAATTSNDKGFFEMELQPGKYSLFVIKNGEIQHSALIMDVDNNVNKIIVNDEFASESNLIVDKAAY